MCTVKSSAFRQDQSSARGGRITCSSRLMRRQFGYSLMELMVALTIGLLIVAGLAGTYATSSAARSETEKSSRQNDNGRYAMQIISDDLKHAGYLGEFNPNQLPPLTAKPTDPCTTTLSQLQTDFRVPVQGYDNSAGALTCISDVRPNTDVIVVRRVSTCVVGATDCDAAVAGLPYFQVSGCASKSELSSGDPKKFYGLETDKSKLTLHKKDCTDTNAGTVAPLRQYRVHIYFVANNDKSSDGIPTLKRAELSWNTSSTTPKLDFLIVPLVEGIENLQFEYGIDTATPSSGTPAFYTADPDSYGTCVAAVCAGYWQNTVALKLYVLARNILPSSGFSDGKTYKLGLKADGVTANTVTPAELNYKRHLFESVVLLNNVAGRNLP